jgi:hypothetical protein
MYKRKKSKKGKPYLQCEENISFLSTTWTSISSSKVTIKNLDLKSRIQNGEEKKIEKNKKRKRKKRIRRRWALLVPVPSNARTSGRTPEGILRDYRCTFGPPGPARPKPEKARIV